MRALTAETVTIAKTPTPIPLPQVDLTHRPVRSTIISFHVTQCDGCHKKQRISNLWHCPVLGSRSVHLLCDTCAESVYQAHMPLLPEQASAASSVPDALSTFSMKFGAGICSVAACCLAYNAAGKNDIGDLFAITFMLGAQIILGRLA